MSVLWEGEVCVKMCSLEEFALTNPQGGKVNTRNKVSILRYKTLAENG